MLGQWIDPYTWELSTMGETPDQAAATERAIAASLEGEGGTGGGVGAGQPESVTYAPAGEGSGFWESVWAGVQAPFKAVGGVLEGVETTGRYLPVILVILGGVAIYVMAPRAPGGK